VIATVLVAMMLTSSVPENPGDSISLETPNGTLAGTLELPAKCPCPVVLIIAGSGPTDRDGNSPLLPGANNSLKYLAEGLAAKGIASVRYDKRGIGASKAAMHGGESDLRFDDYVNDAVGWLGKLRADKRFTTVSVVGHSEGSLIGMIAARQAKADAFVSIAGAGRAAGKIIHEQLASRVPPELLAAADRTIAQLERGETPDSAPPALGALFRPSVQPYLMSWFKYDPAVEIAKLTIPTLIVHGTTDIQVTVADAKALGAAQPKATLLIIDGMNHVMKGVPADQAAQLKSYSDPSLPVVPALVDAVVGLVAKARGGS
jgi:pimeloyl-ACP methyl ester carboxylesterase